MASPELWLEVLSWTKALFDFVTTSADLYGAYEKHRHEKDTITESRRVARVFSTFSDDEVQAMLGRLQGCRDRFIAQGGGSERAACICSVLDEARRANGGALPEIDDWRRIYSTLGCGDKH